MVSSFVLIGEHICTVQLLTAPCRLRKIVIDLVQAEGMRVRGEIARKAAYLHELQAQVTWAHISAN